MTTIAWPLLLAASRLAAEHERRFIDERGHIVDPEHCHCATAQRWRDTAADAREHFRLEKE